MPSIRREQNQMEFLALLSLEVTGLKHARTIWLSSCKCCIMSHENQSQAGKEISRKTLKNNDMNISIRNDLGK